MAALTSTSHRAYALFVTLNNLNVCIRAEGNRIRWKAPHGAMTVDLVRQIKAHEAELVRIVNEFTIAVEEAH